MTFTTESFLFLFLPIAFVFHRICRIINSDSLALMLINFIFYYFIGGQFILLLIYIIFITWIFVRLISKVKNKWHSLLTVFGSIFLLCPLFYFKYFSTNLQFMFLPIGISFYTIQALGYLLDFYRNEEINPPHLIGIAKFISFFPQLSSGPISRYNDFSKFQFDRKISNVEISDGFFYFIAGFSKKVLIADNLSYFSDFIFKMPDNVSGVFYIIGLLAYSLQIYFDFSGHSEMALGIGKLFGIELPLNFNSPYQSSSIVEFWTRWHISLSNWFKDFLYIPLAMAIIRHTKSRALQLAPHFICMVIIGAWHGAGWNFIFFGAWHGAALVFDNYFFSKSKSKIVKLFRRIFCFFVYTLAYLPFRLSDLKSVNLYLSNMFQNLSLSGFGNILKSMSTECIEGVVILPIAFYIAYFSKNVFDILKSKSNVMLLGFSFLFLIAIIENLSHKQIPFIYFKF